MEELEREIEDLKEEIEDLEAERLKKELELKKKESNILPYKIKACKYRERNYCAYFKDATTDADCMDCISQWDVWQRKEGRC
jgi:chromosome segregation ATPase